MRSARSQESKAMERCTRCSHPRVLHAKDHRCTGLKNFAMTSTPVSSANLCHCLRFVKFTQLGEEDHSSGKLQKRLL